MADPLIPPPAGALRQWTAETETRILALRDRADTRAATARWLWGLRRVLVEAGEAVGPAVLEALALALVRATVSHLAPSDSE